MSFDPRIFRNKDGVGMPADDVATDSTSPWTAVSLLKGIYALYSTGNGSLTAINTKLDLLHADATASLPASTATVSSLASSATSAQALAANANRRMATFFNTDANALLLKLGTTASASSFTVRIVQNAFFELPKPVYTGRIDAIWEADGAGSLIVTEF